MCGFILFIDCVSPLLISGEGEFFPLSVLTETDRRRNSGGLLNLDLNLGSQPNTADDCSTKDLLNVENTVSTLEDGLVNKVAETLTALTGGLNDRQSRCGQENENNGGCEHQKPTPQIIPTTKTAPPLLPVSGSGDVCTCLTGFVKELTNGFAGELTRGLTNGLTDGLTKGLNNGLSQGLISGLTQGVFDRLGQELTHGLTNGLDNGLTKGLTTGLTEGFTKGLSVGLASGLKEGLGEQLKGLFSGLTQGLSSGLTTGLTDGLKGGLVGGLSEGLISGLNGGLTKGLTGGLAGLTNTLTNDLTTDLTKNLDILKGLLGDINGGLVEKLLGKNGPISGLTNELLENTSPGLIIGLLRGKVTQELLGNEQGGLLSALLGTNKGLSGVLLGGQKDGQGRADGILGAGENMNFLDICNIKNPINLA